MSSQPSTSSDTAAKRAKSELYDREFLGPWGRFSLFFIWIVILGLAFYLTISAWPKTSTWLSVLTTETRYLLLVVSGGALGSTLTSLTSFAQYIENQRIPRTLWWRYWIKVAIVVPLEMAMYMIIRGGLLSPEAASLDYLNPYGILFASVILGVFVTPIIERLSAIARTLSERESKSDHQIDRIATALGVATLDNYHGYICLSLRDEQGKDVSLTEENTLLISAGQSHELDAWFQPNKPDGITANEIRVAGGSDTRTVEFNLTPDSDSMSLQPRHETVSFGVVDHSPTVRFKFRAPETEDTGELWLNVTQKNRLVQVVPVTFHVQKKAE